LLRKLNPLPLALKKFTKILFKNTEITLKNSVFTIGITSLKCWVRTVSGMNERFERGLMAGAVATCTASCATLMAIALQPEQILQPLSISLGLPMSEEVEFVSPSASVELMPLPPQAAGLDHASMFSSSGAAASSWEFATSQLTLMTEPAIAKDCAGSDQFAIASNALATCALALSQPPSNQIAFEFPPLLTAVEMPAANLNQSFFELGYQ
jgi:hypothetical protein